MDNNSITWMVCGLLLLAVFLRFKSQVFAFLYRLTRIEFPRLKKTPIKTELIRPADAKPWTWYRLWLNVLLHPNAKTSKTLLSEGNSSFLRACMWLVSMSIVLQIFYSVVFWLRSPFPIGAVDVLKFLGNCLFTGSVLPVAFVFLTVLIHIIAKLLGSREAFREFFIVYIAFSIPVTILAIASQPISQIFTGKIPSYISAGLIFYSFLAVPIKAVRSYYHFGGFKSFLIILFVQIVISFLVLIMLTYQNILNS